MKQLILVFDDYDMKSYYNILRSDIDFKYKHILVVDKCFNQKIDVELYGVEHIQSKKFCPKPKITYSFAFNGHNEESISAILRKLKESNVSFNLGFISKGKFKRIAYYKRKKVTEKISH